MSENEYCCPEFEDFGVCDHSKSKPVVIWGKAIRVVRLDPEGNPVGSEEVHLPALGEALVEMLFPETEGEEMIIFDDSVWPAFRRVAFEFTDASPEALALLFGPAFHALKPRPWWWRFLPKRVQQRIKRREIRRGYGN